MANNVPGVTRRIVGKIGESAVGTVKGAAKTVVAAANPLNILRVGGGPIGATIASSIETVFGTVSDAVKETKAAREAAEDAAQAQTDEQKNTTNELEKLREQLKEQQNQDRELFGKGNNNGILAEILSTVDFSNELLFEMINIQNEAAESQREQLFQGIEDKRESRRKVEEGTKTEEKEEKEKESFLSGIIRGLKKFAIAGGLLAALAGILFLIRPDRIQKWVNDLKNISMDDIVKNLKEFQEKFQNSLNKVIEFWDNGVAILDEINLFWQFSMERLEGAFLLFKDIFVAISDFIITIRNTIFDALLASEEFIVGKWTQFMNGIQGISNFINDIWNDFKAGLGIIKDFAIDVKDNFFTGLNLIKDFFGSVWDTITNAVNIAQMKLEEIVGKKRLDTLINSIKNGIGKIADFLTAIPKRVVGFMQKWLPDWAIPSRLISAVQTTPTRNLDPVSIPPAPPKPTPVKPKKGEGIKIIEGKERRLQALQRLLEQGAINDREFAVKKAKIEIETKRKLLSSKKKSIGPAASMATAREVFETEDKQIASRAEPQETFGGKRDELTREPPTSVPSEFNFDAFRETLGQRESGGKYNIQNKFGFAGKYQFGHTALEDVGLLKKGASKKGRVAKVLADPRNWTIEGGLTTFLNDPQIQETAFKKFTDINFNRLKKMGIITNTSSAEDIAGALFAAHLGGVRKAANLIRSGQAFRDGFGTSISEYYKLGRLSQTTGGAPEAIQIAKAGSGISGLGPTTSFLPSGSLGNIFGQPGSSLTAGLEGLGGGDLSSKIASFDAEGLVRGKLALLDTIEQNLGLQSAKNVKAANQGGGNLINTSNNKNINTSRTTVNQQGLRHQEGTIQRLTDSQHVG